MVHPPSRTVSHPKDKTLLGLIPAPPSSNKAVDPCRKLNVCFIFFFFGFISVLIRGVQVSDLSWKKVIPGDIWGRKMVSVLICAPEKLPQPRCIGLEVSNDSEG